MKLFLIVLSFCVILIPSLQAQSRLQKNIDQKNYQAVIADLKGKLEKARKKEWAHEQFYILTNLASVQYLENPKNPEAYKHLNEALGLHKTIIEKYGEPDIKDYWLYAWDLASASSEMGKYDEARSLYADLTAALYSTPFLKNESDSVGFFEDYDWINTLFGERENTYQFADDSDAKPSRLRLLFANALAGDQKNIQAENILLGDHLKLKNQKPINKELYFEYATTLCNHYLDLELYSEAHLYLMDAILFAKQTNVPDFQNNVYQLAGTYYAQIGNTDKALHYFQKCIQASNDNKESNLELQINIAELKKSHSKDSLLQIVEKEYRKEYLTGSLNLAFSLYGISIAAESHVYQLKLFQEAERSITPLFPKENCYLLPRIYQGIGIAYERLGKFDSAMYSFDKSKRISEAMGIKCNKCHGLTLIGLGDAALKQGGQAKSQNYYTNANQFYYGIYGGIHSFTRLSASRLIDTDWYFKSYQNASAGFRKSFDQSADIIKAYFPVLTEQDREAFYKTLKSDYDKYPFFVINFYKADPSLTGDLYNHQLQTKAFLLNNFNKWKNQIINSGDIKLIREFDQWQTNKELLAKVSHLEVADAKDLKINIDSLTRVTDVLERKLYEKAQGYSNESDQPATWQNIREKLGENEAAIEIIRFNSFDLEQHALTDSVLYCALIVTRQTNQPKLILLDDGNRLENRYTKAYLNKARLQANDDLSYDAFWKKINSELKGIATIYLSPDGAFHQININTLFNPVTGKYISEEYNIRQVTNTKELLLMKREETFNKTGYLFGSPDFFFRDKLAADDFQKKVGVEKNNGTQRGLSLEDLPGTKEEVESIAQIMKQKGWTTQLFTEKEATEENLKSNYKPRVLHIATHGYFNLGHFSDLAIVKSGLILAGGGNTLNNYFDLDQYKPEGEDGILTPYEAMNLNLENTDLVVLSACQSGMGDVIPGEGIYGLQRSFKMAGARNLIISLWPVDDAATKEFIQEFYKGWLLNGKTKADAFKDAQATLKKKYPAPYYWGAFILVGI